MQHLGTGERELPVGTEGRSGGAPSIPSNVAGSLPGIEAGFSAMHHCALPGGCFVVLWSYFPGYGS